ncbi:MAG TPA: TRAP transporter small permease subunit [Usitatibacter sp.]|nr:TRAP transporter small permease subunit [Usitatibacter sp.]
MATMGIQKYLITIDHISTWTGKAASWLILVLTGAVCVEVLKRYALNAPTAWAFDADYMLYGVLFMMCGAYTLSQDGHVRGDFLYSSMKPRLQASLDLVLYVVFFLPGIAALSYAGWDFAHASWVIDEHVNDTANGPPLYHFKAIIPIAGTLVLIQGIAEIIRCVICLRTGRWPDRLKDAEEIDVVEEQLANSQYVDEESRKRAIESVHEIDEAARQRQSGAKGAERSEQ